MKTAKVYSVKRGFSDVLDGVTSTIFQGQAPRPHFPTETGPIKNFLAVDLFHLPEEICSIQAHPKF